jgi:hypothetical protein
MCIDYLYHSRKTYTQDIKSTLLNCNDKIIPSKKGNQLTNPFVNSQFLIRAKSAMISGNPLRRLIDYISGFILFSVSQNIRRSIFTGKFYYCPICETHLRTFLRLYRPYHAWCPVCRSLQRHRLAWIFLNSEHIQIDQNELRMLHFAPEPGIATRLEAIPSLEYISADLYDKKASIKMDVCDIRFPDESFDLIYCSHVLEHVPDDSLAMREFHRVLKIHGKIILQVPIAGEETFEDLSVANPLEREKLFGQIDHVRIYGKDIIQRLTNAGFCVKEFVTEDLVPSEDIERMGLISGEIIFLCEK